MSRKSVELTHATFGNEYAMNQSPCLRTSTLLGLTAWLTCLSADVHAQNLRGGEIHIPAVVSVEERFSQYDFWILDVYCKPIRMIPVELTNAQTGEKKLEYVWYIVYRAFHQRASEPIDDTSPRNEFDPPVSPPLFIPEATLVVTDNDRHAIFPDQVIPEALAAINKREKANYKTAVDVVGPLVDESEAKASDRKGVWGVMMWRGIDPDADKYTVFLAGFSNGIRKLNGPDDVTIIQTKTIMQKYLRRGDRFDQAEPEIIPDPSKPESEWIYR